MAKLMTEKNSVDLWRTVGSTCSARYSCGYVSVTDSILLTLIPHLPSPGQTTLFCQMIEVHPLS